MKTKFAFLLLAGLALRLSAANNQVLAWNMPATNTGTIAITAPMTLAAVPLSGTSLKLVWPANLPGVIVEQSDTLGGNAIWTPVTIPPVVGPANSTVTIPAANGNRFYRVRRAW